MYRVLIADDHPLFRRALREAVDSTGEDCELIECEQLDQALAIITHQQPDLLLLDLKMPGSSGLAGLAQIRSAYPELAVVVVTASEDGTVASRVRQLGALGFIPKSASIETMTQALRSVLQGKLVFPEFVSQTPDELTRKLASLTPQQLKVLVLISEGALNKQIGYTLDIKETTVKSHVRDIFRKLDIINRTQAAMVIQQLQIPD
ncbi:response regulator transcription factor [Parathalassolituus penaei]|uniref:Response regulator transcription factor n=1 Tax=Parathalassolituus penaei TaxID=2997323 RepID=A0A9X3EH26_9GAMM|nr:response regulator transcription factor [Parathalassolituus penaei]MCY0967443.1 response regulator transcription factor [Parathalassolituus penaei]